MKRRRAKLARVRLATIALVLGAAGAPIAGAVVACGGGSRADDGAADASIDRARLSQPIHPDASCPVTIDSPPLEPGVHVPIGTPITWDSNPPSSGTHYPIWANFQEFDAPVDLGFVVHDMEHGAVVMFYKPCDDADATCQGIVEGFRKVRESIPTDPVCDPSIRVRVVIVPEPSIPTPVAAATWGWIYTADCLDLPTLTDFANAHYRQGTEDLCAPGQTQF